MASLVNERIAAFEEMARAETVNVKQFPVPKHSVLKLISFFEHRVPGRDGEDSRGGQEVQKVVEASKAPTTTSEGSSYWSVRSHFEENDMSCQIAGDEPCQNGVSPKPVHAAGEYDATRLRRSQFIFHINAPATNIPEAIARAERGRGLPGVKFFVSKGIKILKNATTGRPASSTAKKEQPQPSRGQPSTVRNTVKFLTRRITNMDPSTSAITPTRSESGEENGIRHGVEGGEGKRAGGKEIETNTTSPSRNKQAYQNMRNGKSFADNMGSIRALAKKIGKASSPEKVGCTYNTSKKEGKKSSAEDPRHIRETTNAIGEKSPALNITSVPKTAMTDGKKSSSENPRSIRKITKADVERSPTTNTGSASNTAKKEDKKSFPEHTGSARTTMLKGIKKSPATSTGRACKTMTADSKRSPTTNLGSARNTTKKGGNRPPPKNLECVRKTIKTDDRKAVPTNTTSVRKTTRMDESASTVTPMRSERGDENRMGLGRVGARRRTSLFYKLRAKIRQRRERRQRSEQRIVVQQFSQRVSSQSKTTIPIEVNVPYPKDATELGNSFTATIHLKVSLTRDNE